MKSMYLALVSLIVAIFSLFNSLCFHIEDNSLIVSFLGVLVTLLVGWNIIQFIFAEKNMKEIATKASIDTAVDVVKAFKISKQLEKADNDRKQKKYISSIDKYFYAISDIMCLSESHIRQYEIDDAILGLKEALSLSQSKKGCPWILQGRKPYYESILKSLSRFSQEEYTYLLSSAEEHPINDDEQFWDESMEL